MKEIYIAGAHSRAKTLGVYLKTIYGVRIKAYLVSGNEINPDSIDGIPVIHIDSDSKSFINELNRECAVYIGSKMVWHDKLTNELRSIGLSNIIPVTPTLDCQLRNEYLKIFYNSIGRKFIKLDELEIDDGDTTRRKCSIEQNNCHTDTTIIGENNIDNKSNVYVIKSVFDAELVGNVEENKLRSFEMELQVGKSLTNNQICTLSDDIGENISLLNKQFCELTGLYWIWKNSDAHIVGLEHYRRRFILPNNWQKLFALGKIDVILPTPLYVHPSLGSNYIERHVSKDLDILFTVCEELYGAEAEDIRCFFDNTGIYSPCNMIITRKDILDELCEWLFPILFKCNEIIGKHSDTYQNRYVGFMSERLINYYFDKLRDKYSIVYADKTFLT